MKKDSWLNALSSKARNTALFLLPLVAASSLVAAPAWADRFSNRFIEFELPPQWTCVLEQAEWVCQGTDEAKKREAIVILAAKLKGDNDSIEQFLNYLKQPKSYTSAAGKSIQSEPKYAQEKDLNGHVWVDSLHNDSEIPGFVTRYLATTKEDIAVLVTYSIVKNKYQDYLSDFETLVRTMKVFRQAGGLNSTGDSAAGGNSGMLTSGISEGTVFPNLGDLGGSSQKKAGTSGVPEELPWIPIAAVLAALAYIAWRRNQKR